MTTFRTSPLLTTLPLALGLGACVDGNADSAFSILHVVPAETGCVFSTGGDAILPAGTIDVAAPGGYLLAPEIRNDLILGDAEAEITKTIFLTGAKVEIDFYDTALFSAAEVSAFETEGLTRFLSPFGASLPPDGATAVIPFEAIPVELIRAIGDKLPQRTEGGPPPRTTLDLHVRMVGTRGGSDVESNVFRYPVQVCDGCLISVLGQCATLPTTTPVRPGGFCQLGQDGVQDCCIDDHDDLEVPCEEGQPPPDGFACDDMEDQPAILQCPARPLEL